MVHYLKVDKEKVIKAQIMNDCLNVLGVKYPGEYASSDAVESILKAIHESVSKKGKYKGYPFLEKKISLWGKVIVKRSIREMYKKYRIAA